MSTSESLGALRRANPRAGAGFAQSVEAAAATVRTRIPADTGIREPRSAARRRPRRLVGVSVFGASLAGVCTNDRHEAALADAGLADDHDDPAKSAADFVKRAP